MIYKNISNLRSGVYQNKDYDLNHNRFYIKSINDSLDIKLFGDLKEQPLNPQIYDSPNYWPLLHRDLSISSCFKDYIVPTGSYKFVVNKDNIEVIKREPTIDYITYVNNSFLILEEDINSIFNRHDEVIIPSNGGIDTLVILSYVLRMGYIGKVRIINQYNLISRSVSPNELYNLNKESYQNFENYFTPLVKEFKYDLLTYDDLLHVINTYDYEKLKCYSTTKIFLSYKNVGIVFGFGGNQTLLHHTPILDMVFSKSKIPNKKEILHKLVTAKNYYSASPFTHAYDVDKTTFCKIEDFTYQYKPWKSFDGFNQNKMYYPLGSISHLARELDYSTVDFETILHAKMCRELIYRNVGSLFDNFIGVTTPYDSDNFINVSFNKEKINPECLLIPNTLMHDKEKLINLENRLKHDTIDHFTISIIKMLQHMDQLLNI